ncbi:orotidine-5'-phosphate decarboxylase [Actinomadura opuntiae]|uniref:orotidine-5'-phosphate decarboxylase n=1 Tax=Actinomadura sp. OS1-43 TaxID=604315 RepID=UPI00255ACF2E|nr:orotidine-5'-phosphate decarboxylase [Actinomadura sp. OS1-43]MDL4819020.1 orotidine-5'-phosphate decarboxylase [Actinomadura sp. OS1-43]
MGESFGERVAGRLAGRGPLCVGIDPSSELVEGWGLPDTPAGLERFCGGVLDAVGDVAAVVKPQSAFFERFGSKGIAVLEQVIGRAREMGAVVILDVKRGDVGSTTAAYAQAYLDRRSPLAADAVTASPYLGLGSLRPMIDTALENDAGVFVLARTSNPEGADVQLAVGPTGRSVADEIIDGVAQINAGAAGPGSIGVVLGATLSGLEGAALRVNGPVLAPGVGAQGAGPDDVRRVFGRASGRVIPSASRALLATGPDRLRSETMRLVSECRVSLADPGRAAANV